MSGLHRVHLQSCFKEHIKNQGPMTQHLENCDTPLSEDVDIFHEMARGESHLLTLEALYIQEHKPEIYTKDEYRSRTLTIKL